MEQLKAFDFLEANKDYLFPNSKFTDSDIEKALLDAPEVFEMSMNSILFKKPSTVKWISVFVGSLGVDRFYLGDTKKGVLKYFSYGGLGIWWIKDIRSAEDRCRAYNCQKLLDAINDPSVIATMLENKEKMDNLKEAAVAAAPVAIAVAKGTKELRNSFTEGPY